MIVLTTIDEVLCVVEFILSPFYLTGSGPKDKTKDFQTWLPNILVLER